MHERVAVPRQLAVAGLARPPRPWLADTAPHQATHHEVSHCQAVDNAVAAFELAETHLESQWDALASTIHDVLSGFVDLARGRDAALIEDAASHSSHVDTALNRLARGSSFETRSTPPRGREVPSRINELRLARLLLDGALSALEPSE